ncbi:putative alanine racemase [Selenomonas ruminantium subsp. lactilytica TAM6421]|uniref:Alanine racemase n=1 Tax=Selenomonas ruminantium subsp. lactilytica (strain NBRC 103574 / TAM6421) TaxID=927704 RepID=I0GU89_SELRL|nr:alanine racemase [Selenomonas ruminantium]BAL84326.1 putative alanine racemase [Selenomonas ruminantium subsp. lactilytica TAM6421]
MPNRPAWAEINLQALRHNYREIKKQLAEGVKMCAVIKANAYGHGATVAARVALEEGAEYFAVAALSEAIELRQAGFTTPILVLGLIDPKDAGEVVDYDITQVVCELGLAKALSAAAQAQGKQVKVHLKVDTGMGRIGVRKEEIGALAAEIKQLPGLVIEGMFSHFATADLKDKTYTKQQLAAFKEAVAAVEAQGVKLSLRHIAESAAILEIPEAHFDMVRAGIIQYGLWPSEEVTHPIDLQPVMTLKAKITWVKTLQVGESIGYGRKFTAARESRIATLPLGYADGYLRLYTKYGHVMIHGAKAPFVGGGCMDQMMVDVTDIPDVKIGDEAILFGTPELTIDEVAGWGQTINYEVPCLIGPRIPRVYK